MKAKIYLARPITGSNGEDVLDYYQHMKDVLTDFGYEVFQPMTGKGYLRTEKDFKATGYELLPPSTNHAIFERDMWMVRTSDVVYADLTGATKVSIGCVSELAAASVLGKHTVIAMEKDNPHRHAFILEAADIVFETPLDAIKYLEKLALQTS